MTADPGDRLSGEAPAKVNLFLRVLSREASGYHGIETLFCRIGLADELIDFSKSQPARTESGPNFQIAIVLAQALNELHMNEDTRAAVRAFLGPNLFPDAGPPPIAKSEELIHCGHQPDHPQMIGER